MNMMQKNNFDYLAILSTPQVGLASDFLNEDSSIDNPCNTEYIQVCGNCGHKLAAYQPKYGPAEYGKSTDDGRLSETMCPNCFNGNHRHTSPIATRSFINRMDQDSRWYREIIFARADTAFWHGDLADSIQVSAATEKEPIFGRRAGINNVGLDWTPQCPACGISYEESEFDFHHWDYENDRGCMLCRDCHEHTHQEMTATEQSKETGKDWRNDAIKRLYELSVNNNMGTEYVEEFIYRFNIPSSEEFISPIEGLDNITKQPAGKTDL